MPSEARKGNKKIDAQLPSKAFVQSGSAVQAGFGFRVWVRLLHEFGIQGLVLISLLMQMELELSRNCIMACSDSICSPRIMELWDTLAKLYNF